MPTYFAPRQQCVALLSPFGRFFRVSLSNCCRSRPPLTACQKKTSYDLLAYVAGYPRSHEKCHQEHRPGALCGRGLRHCLGPLRLWPSQVHVEGTHRCSRAVSLYGEARTFNGTCTLLIDMGRLWQLGNFEFSERIFNEVDDFYMHVTNFLNKKLQEQVAQQGGAPVPTFSPKAWKTTIGL